jgi:hypothetical protein
MPRQPATLATPAGAHRLKEGLEGGGHAEQVDLQHAAHHGEVARLRGVETTGHTRVGDHEVRRAGAAYPVRRHRLHRDRVRHVGLVDGTALGRQRSERSQRRALQADQRHTRATGDEFTRQRLAQATAGTGHHGVVKTRCRHRPSPRSCARNVGVSRIRLEIIY